MNGSLVISGSELNAPLADINEDCKDDDNEQNDGQNDNICQNETDAPNLDQMHNMCESLENLVQTFETRVNEFSVRKKIAKMPKRSNTCDMIYDLR
jgi:hypothetical protein